MADTDETSVAFAREAEQATQAVEKDSAALRPLLTALEYSNELRLLDEFDQRFAEYRKLDRSVLDLAVENTNLKAQRLSFGPAQEAADAFQNSLDALVPAAQADDMARQGARRNRCRGRSRNPGAAGAAHRRVRRCRDDAHRDSG